MRALRRARRAISLAAPLVLLATTFARPVRAVAAEAASAPSPPAAVTPAPSPLDAPPSAPPVAPPGDATASVPATPPSPRLDALRRKAERRRAQLEAFERRERGLLETLDEIDRASAELEHELAQAEAALAGARLRLSDARLVARDAESRRAQAADALARRAVALYREGETGFLRAAFSPGTLRDRMARVQLLRTLAARDARLVARYRDADRLLAEARTSADAARAARDRAVADTRERRAVLREEREARSALLASLRGDRRREEAALAELEAAAQALGARLGAMPGAPLGGGPGAAPGAAPHVSSPPPSTPTSESLPPAPLTPFALLRGRLPLPVDAPLRQPFGSRVDARFGTRTFRRGVELAARQGEAVRAVAAGEVRFAGWFRGYGRMVIVDHGDRYFTVFGHLHEIVVAVGDRIDAGHELGRAGESGSLDGPGLHFEVRRGGDALDPAEWLAGLPRARNAQRRVE